MSNIDKSNIENWFNEKWLAKNRACDICDCPNWILGKNLVEVNQINVPDETIHMLMFVCKNCGNTKFANKNFV